MKFFIDANLPFKLTLLLRQKGYNVLHTEDCFRKERTTDVEIRNIATQENRIVITKDSDFLDSHLIKGIPQKLLLIGTGNITNIELFQLIEKYFAEIVHLFNNTDLIELTNDQIITHERIK